MRIRMIQFGLFSLLIICICVSQCNCELPANSYGPPPKSDNKPASSYGPPPSPDIKPPSPGSAAGPTSDGSGGEGEAKPEPFNFMYEVKDMASGNDYSHKQESDGKTVKGEYKVLLPDGRNQVVTYTADAMGYNAEVKYDGEARPGPPGPGPGAGPGPGDAPGGGKAGPGGGAGPPGGGYPSGKPASGGGGGYPSGGPPPGAPSFDGYPPAGPPANKGPPPAPAAPPSNSYLPPAGFSAGY